MLLEEVACKKLGQAIFSAMSTSPSNESFSNLPRDLGGTFPKGALLKMYHTIVAKVWSRWPYLV